MSAPTVLCVDTDTDRRAATERALSGSVMEAASVADAQSALDDGTVDAVVTDYELDDGTGLAVVEHVRETAPDTPCVLFTDARPGDIDTAQFPTMVVEYLARDAPNAYQRLDELVVDLVETSAQMGYIMPDDEAERREAVAEYAVDGLDVETSLDRLSMLAARHLDVEVAFVGIVGAHQEDILACHGGDWDVVPREDTICTHAILEDDVFVVEDIREDFRFKDNDALASMGVRSYAGANLETPAGDVIGSFCLVDFEPRSFDADERADLQRFADEAMEQLELRRRLTERQLPAEVSD